MSALRVEVTKIHKVIPHPNADRLDIAYLFGEDGWPVVTGRHTYQVNELVAYIPVDSILTDSNLEARLFPPDSKIRLYRSRVKAIKIRGQVSQGMIVSASSLFDYVQPEEFQEGFDLAERLGIIKYEPPAHLVPKNMKLQAKKPKPDLKAFKKYTDVENYKFWTRELLRGEEVVATAKLHGTSARFTWAKSEANVWYQKVLKFFGLLPEWTFAWGSRNVQIQAKLRKRHQGCQIASQGVDFGDVYTEAVEKYDLKNRIPKGWVIYGEIVGDGIQKNYLYGCGKGEHSLYLYDIMVDGKWLDYTGEGNFFEAAHSIGLQTVPIVYQGPWDSSLVDGLVQINPLSSEVAEGVVARPAKERSHPQLGRTVLKLINTAYLLKDNTNFH